MNSYSTKGQGNRNGMIVDNIIIVATTAIEAILFYFLYFIPCLDLVRKYDQYRGGKRLNGLAGVCFLAIALWGAFWLTFGVSMVALKQMPFIITSICFYASGYFVYRGLRKKFGD